MSEPHESDDPTLEVMAAEIRALLVDLAAVERRATELGIFIDDRELLACPICGLLEDVAADGRLKTYFSADLRNASREPPDSRMRFQEVRQRICKCPQCGALLQVDDGF